MKKLKMNREKETKGKIVLRKNFKEDWEKILIDIRDFKKKEKVKLIKSIIRFGQLNKDRYKLEIIKCLFERTDRDKRREIKNGRRRNR